MPGSDSWRGIGLIVVGMLRYGFDLNLTSYPQGWRATFLHRNYLLMQPWSAKSSRAGRRPWRAVQDAAWRALNTPMVPDQSQIGASPR